MNEKNIDFVKVEQLAKLLDEMIRIVQEYQKQAKDLSYNELMLGGSFAISLFSPWSNHRIIGTLGNGFTIAALLEDLVNTYNVNKKQHASQPSPSLTPFSSDKKDFN